MKILVIEDHSNSMKLVHHILAGLDHTVLCAENAEKGLEMARRELPDLILMDIMLPGIDGFEAARLLRNDPLTRHIKIVAYTALAMPGDRDKVFQSGFDDYMAKPFRYQEFVSMINKFDNAS